MKRRHFLEAILAAGIAPAVVRAESLMRTKVLPSGLLVPDDVITLEHIRKAVAMLNRTPRILCHPTDFDMEGLYGL